MPTTPDPTPARPSRFQSFLNLVERAGNALPHPATLFAGLAVLVLGQPLTASLWIATVMTCVAMALLGGEWRADRTRMLSSLLYGGLAAFLFATSDILTQTWVGELGMTHFAPLAFGAMLLYSWLLVPKFSQPLRALPAPSTGTRVSPFTGVSHSA